jgi:hypothetical protein
VRIDPDWSPITSPPEEANDADWTATFTPIAPGNPPIQ